MLTIEDFTNKVLESVEQQAARYGEQVRILEDRGLEEDRARVRAAWETFRNQFGPSIYSTLARNAYWDAYCEKGFQRKLP